MFNKLTLCHGVGFSGRICTKRDTCRRFLLLQSDNNTLIPRQQSTFMCNLDHLYYINHYCNDGDDIIIVANGPINSITKIKYNDANGDDVSHTRIDGNIIYFP